jgi:hypothetical protein
MPWQKICAFKTFLTLKFPFPVSGHNVVASLCNLVGLLLAARPFAVAAECVGSKLLEMDISCDGGIPVCPTANL